MVNTKMEWLHTGAVAFYPRYAKSYVTKQTKLFTLYIMELLMYIEAPYEFALL